MMSDGRNRQSGGTARSSSGGERPPPHGRGSRRGTEVDEDLDLFRRWASGLGRTLAGTGRGPRPSSPRLAAGALARGVARRRRGRRFDRTGSAIRPGSTRARTTSTCILREADARDVRLTYPPHTPAFQPLPGRRRDDHLGPEPRSDLPRPRARLSSWCRAPVKHLTTPGLRPRPGARGAAARPAALGRGHPRGVGAVAGSIAMQIRHIPGQARDPCPTFPFEGREAEPPYLRHDANSPGLANPGLSVRRRPNPSPGRRREMPRTSDDAKALNEGLEQLRQRGLRPGRRTQRDRRRPAATPGGPTTSRTGSRRWPARSAQARSPRVAPVYDEVPSPWASPGHDDATLAARGLVNALAE